MVHRRWIGTAVLGAFAAQCGLVVAFAGPNGATYVSETLVGLILLVIFVTSIPKRIVTSAESFSISGFYLGVPKTTVHAEDVISVVFRLAHLPGGRAPAQWFVVGLRAQSSAGDFQLPIYGWTGNRQLFRCIAEMVSSSGIPVDSRTAEVLTRVSGIAVQPR